MGFESVLTDILSGVRTEQTQAGETAKLLQNATSQGQEIIGAMQKVYEQVSNDVAIVNSAKNAALLRANAAARNVGASFGVDDALPADRLASLATKKRELDEQSLQKLDELHRQANINPTDDLLGFLGAQLYGIGSARAEYRQAKGKAEVVNKQIAETNTAIQQSAQTYQVIQAAVTQTAAEAATRISAAESTLKAQQLKLDGLRLNTEGVLKAQQLTSQQLDRMFQIRSAQQAEQQLALALKNYELDKERFDFTKEERKLINEARKEGKELDEDVVEKINLGYAAIGIPPIEGLEAKQVIQAFKAGKQELWEAYQRGRATKALGFAVIGTTPSNAIAVLSQNPLATLPPAREPVVRVLRDAREIVAKDLKIDKKDPAAVENALNKVVQQQIALQYARTDSSEDNIFNVGDLKQYMGSTATGVPPMKAIGGTALYQKYFKPLVDAGADLSKPRIVYDSVVSAVENNQLTFEEAMQLVTIYRAAAEVNMAARGLPSFGIVPPGAGKTLNITIGRFGRMMDITDPIAVSRELSKDLAVRKYRAEIPENLMGTPENIVPQLSTTPD